MNTYKVTPISRFGACAPSFFVEATDRKVILPEIKKATRLADFPDYWSFEIVNV